MTVDFIRLLNRDIDLEFIVARGEHSHPPPPRVKIPRELKERLQAHVFTTPGATPTRVMASAHLFGSGRTGIAEHPGLGNYDAVQRVMVSARKQKHGDGFEGALFEMIRPRDDLTVTPLQSSFSGYAQKTEAHADGHAFVVCMLGSMKNNSGQR